MSLVREGFITLLQHHTLALVNLVKSVVEVFLEIAGHTLEEQGWQRRRCFGAIASVR